jgi:Zn finger protein HypA/HybF involved in hydrogenase expression
MADTIKIEIKEFESPKVKCATCDNTMSESRAFSFPICDDCLKAMREIIKENK